MTAVRVPAVPVAVTALWHSQLRALAQDVEWGLSQTAVAGRLRGLLADIDRAEHRALEQLTPSHVSHRRTA